MNKIEKRINNLSIRTILRTTKNINHRRWLVPLRILSLPSVIPYISIGICSGNGCVSCEKVNYSEVFARVITSL